jgi:hypothetical protein
MVVQTAELVFNDNPSKYNKDLTDFLKRNISTIITKGQIRFRFKIAKASDLTALRQRGIKRLPAMILHDQPYIGVPVIVEELRTRVKKSKQTASPKSEDEVLDEYYRKTLGNLKKDVDGKHIIPDDDDDDDDDDGVVDLGSKYHKEISRRNPVDDVNHRTAPRNAPPKPDRLAVQDDDFNERIPPARKNNVAEKNAGDPIATLDSMKPKNGEQADEDNMMRTLLERIDGGSDFTI